MLRRRLLRRKRLLLEVQFLVQQFRGRRRMLMHQASSYHSITVCYAISEAFMLDKISATPVRVAVGVRNLFTINESFEH